MKSLINVNKELQIIEVIHQGVCDLPELKEVRVKVAYLMKVYHYKRLLVDTGRADFNILPTEHNFFLMSNNDFFDTGFGIAAVLNGRESNELRSSAEKIIKSYALNLKLFEDKEKAKEWLVKNIG